MKIHVQLFANLKERFGQDYLTMELTETATVADLMKSLKQVYPSLERELNLVLVAKNRVLAEPSAQLSEQDEIALIPPVGGGSENTSTRFLDISATPLVVEEAYRLLEDKNHGGTVLFVGTVREWTRNRQTSHLTYEAYQSMAIQQMDKIRSDIEAEFSGVTTLQWHRVGELKPLDIAVICGASSAHRDSAFQACRKLIERLKAEVAIWKKEQFVDGNAVWQANAQSTPDENV